MKRVAENLCRAQGTRGEEGEKGKKRKKKEGKGGGTQDGACCPHHPLPARTSSVRSVSRNAQPGKGGKEGGKN